MKRIHIYLTLAMLALLGALAFYYSYAHRLRQERDRYQRNTEALIQQLDTFRTSNGRLAARCESLDLTSKEFRRLYEEEAERVKDLRRRNEELSHYVKTHSEAEVIVKTEIRDSLIYVRDSVVIAKVFDWDDGWDSVHAQLSVDSVVVAMSHRDVLDVAVMTEWKRFLGFLWKTKVKGYAVDVVSENPHTRELTVSSVKIK